MLAVARGIHTWIWAIQPARCSKLVLVLVQICKHHVSNSKIQTAPLPTCTVPPPLSQRSGSNSKIQTAPMSTCTVPPSLSERRGWLSQGLIFKKSKQGADQRSCRHQHARGTVCFKIGIVSPGGRRLFQLADPSRCCYWCWRG